MQNNRVHVHIENRSANPLVYHVTEERFRTACARHPEAAEQLQASIDYDGKNFDSAMRTADVLIGFGIPKENLAARAPNLKWIHLTGAGVNHLLPFDWVPPNVVITTSSGAHAAIAADYATMAVLMLNHHIPYFTSSKIRRAYDRVFPIGIWKKTVAIIGVGALGGAVAEGLKRLGVNVIGLRKSGKPHPHVDKMYGPADLGHVLASADIVVLAAPLTKDTRGLIGRAQLDLMKPTAGLLNMGRAGLVDYGALADKLRKRELTGAILDVFDPEPLPSDSFLWDVPNLIMTPHVSSDEEEDYIPGCLDIFFKNLACYRAGKPLLNAVDLSHEY